ncbi:MAG: LamG-like jellyroll fold domain-containing protein, partial [Bacteroidota bacterium]|nr:LamG-like jellyroll fold domain-containing protein [Bacteroidota bacterium]
GDQYLNYNTNAFGHGWGSGGYNSTTPHGFIYDNTTASLNQWYHLVVTRSATESKFYVNGMLINSVSVSSTNSPYYGSGTLKAKIGIRFDNTDPFDGKIDDIRIYERPLTSGDVSSLYSTPTSCSSQSGDLTCNGFVSVNENPLINYDLKLYPNPFSTQVTLQTDNLLHNATLTVYNCFGQTVKQIKNISGQTITLFRDNLPSGLYCIQLTQDNKIITTDKLVITD